MTIDLRAIWERDRHTCGICGAEQTEGQRKFWALRAATDAAAGRVSRNTHSVLRWLRMQGDYAAAARIVEAYAAAGINVDDADDKGDDESR